ncbi:MAG: hypothetical protein HUU15_05265 [Candidatus Brocadiae bacterium]|nr:hypothetical protein [Candidatus Brocadiia bacterium]
MSLTTAPGTVLLLALALAAAARAEDADVYRNEDVGFRIRRPGDGWEMAVGTPYPGTTLTQKAWRKGAASEESVTVFVTDVKEARDAGAACDAAETARRADPKSSRIRRGTREVAGVTAPWLAFDYESGGVTYTLRQHYLTRNESHFILQCAAPAPRFPELEKEFGAALDSFVFLPVPDAAETRRRALLRALADRCGSEVRWAPGWPAAVARAKAEDRLIVVVIEQYRGLKIDRFATPALFTDPDVVALVNERFVAFQWNDRCGAPFEDAQVYGLGPMTFGQGILFTDAAGRVVADAVSFDPSYFDEFARGVLDARPGAAPEGPADAASLLRHGDLAAAARLLESPKTAGEWTLKAALLRRWRRGEDAIGAIAEARRLGAVGLESAEAEILIRMGRFAEAERALAGLEDPDAVWWRTFARGQQQGLEPVRKELEDFAIAHPDHRWAWRAAAIVGRSTYGSGLGRATWTEDARIRGALPSGSAPGRDAAEAERDAVAFLVRTQLPDGSWPSAHTFSEPRGGSAVAVASIAGSGLLPFRDQAGAGAALRNALAFVLANPPASHPDRLFDYTIWGQIFSLRFLAECVQAGVGERDPLLKAMDALVADLHRGRFRDGGWAYFRAQGTDGTSIGFVTAAALCALRDAKAAGAQVPAALTARAEDAVATARQEEGAFRYFIGPGGGAAGREAEAGFRSPLYALVLKRGGKGDVEEVRASLDLYLKYRVHNLRERGKSLCHTSPEGLASYYLLFGAAFAAEAAGELPEEERAKYREAILEDVLAMRTADGAFCDNPGVGRHYGAGMALGALRRLRR